MSQAHNEFANILNVLDKEVLGKHHDTGLSTVSMESFDNFDTVGEKSRATLNATISSLIPGLAKAKDKLYAATDRHMHASGMRTNDPELDHYASMEGAANTEDPTIDTDVGVMAGAIALAMTTGDAGRLNTYRQESASVTTDAIDVSSLASGTHGSISTIPMSEYSAEAFDADDLTMLATHNVAINIAGVRQVPAMERWFPTRVYPPSNTGVKLSVTGGYVKQERYHPDNGRIFDEGMRKIMHGYIDPTIMEAPSMELIPWANPNGDTDHLFADPAVIANQVVEVMGRASVETRPLKAGETFNAISLGQHPGVLNGNRHDGTDQIAHGTRLKNVYLTVKDTVSGTVQAIPFHTMNVARSSFVVPPQADSDREISLHTTFTDFVLDKNTTDIAGANIPGFTAAIVTPDLSVQLKLTLSGTQDLHTGTTHVAMAGKVDVAAVVTSDGTRLALDAGAGLAVVNQLKAMEITFDSYDLYQRLSNTNWRNNPVLMDTKTSSEIFTIPPGEPLAVLSPVKETPDPVKMATMSAGYLIRNANNAVTTILNYFDTLYAHRESMRRGLETRVSGLGRHIVTPYVEDIPVDIAAPLKNVESHERHRSVASVLVNYIKTAVWDMVEGSDYKATLHVQKGNLDAPINVLALTDQTLVRYIYSVYTPAEISSLCGPHINFTLDYMMDERLDGTIHMTFGDDKPSFDNFLGYGVHMFVPELIQRLDHTRNGADVGIARLIPRNIHVPTLPVMTRLRVYNLKEALNDSTPVPLPTNP